MSITREEIRKMAEDMMAAKRAVETEWAEGKRDGHRLQVFALADDVLHLLDAIEKNDPYAYGIAAKEAREHAGNAAMHAHLWIKQTRDDGNLAKAAGDSGKE